MTHLDVADIRRHWQLLGMWGVKALMSFSYPYDNRRSAWKDYSINSPDIKQLEQWTVVQRLHELSKTY
jgi:hypothetical protein